MSPEEIAAALLRQPFVPLRITLQACLERGWGHLSHNMALQIMVESHEESRHGAAAVGAFA